MQSVHAWFRDTYVYSQVTNRKFISERNSIPTNYILRGEIISGIDAVIAAVFIPASSSSCNELVFTVVGSRHLGRTLILLVRRTTSGNFSSLMVAAHVDNLNSTASCSPYSNETFCRWYTQYLARSQFKTQYRTRFSVLFLLAAYSVMQIFTN